MRIFKLLESPLCLHVLRMCSNNYLGCLMASLVMSMSTTVHADTPVRHSGAPDLIANLREWHQDASVTPSSSVFETSCR